METIPETGYSENDTFNLKDMEMSCQFAYIILRAAERLIVRNISCGWEIDERLSVELCDKIFSKFTSQRNLNGYVRKDLEYCYAPRIEGGHDYNFELKTASDSQDLGFHVFKCSAGVRLKKHCCHFVRTVLFRSTKRARENYQFMMLVYKVVLQHLEAGVELREVYEAAWSFAEKQNPHLAKHLQKEFGFELGPNFKIKSVAINANSTVIAQENMVFAININLTGIKEDGGYSLYYSDTVVVRKHEKPRVLTWYKPKHTIIQPLNYITSTTDTKYCDNTSQRECKQPKFRPNWCRYTPDWDQIPCSAVTVSNIEKFALYAGINILQTSISTVNSIQAREFRVEL